MGSPCHQPLLITAIGQQSWFKHNKNTKLDCHVAFDFMAEETEVLGAPKVIKYWHEDNKQQKGIFISSFLEAVGLPELLQSKG